MFIKFFCGLLLSFLVVGCVNNKKVIKMKDEISSYSGLKTYFDKENPIVNPDSKVPIKERYRAGLDFLEKTISKLTEHNREKILDDIYAQKTTESMYYIQAFVLYYSSIDNKVMIGNILSHKCPNRIGIWDDIEYFLIKNTKFKHTFLMFIEAYRKSKNEENKKNIAKIIRRSLKAMGITGGSDSELIDNAEKWYKKNENNLSLNSDYAYDSLEKRVLNSVPLFILKKQKSIKSKNSVQKTEDKE